MRIIVAHRISKFSEVFETEKKRQPVKKGDKKVSHLSPLTDLQLKQCLVLTKIRKRIKSGPIGNYFLNKLYQFSKRAPLSDDQCNRALQIMKELESK